MGDPQQQQDEDLVLSFFPDPPPFYQHFTSENLQRLKDVEEEAAAGADEPSNLTPSTTSKLSAEQILRLPTELRYLIPPEPPADDEAFLVFNETAKVKGSDVFMKNMEYIGHLLKAEDVFQDWAYEQLYPSPTSTDASSEVTSTPESKSATLDRQNYLFRFIRSILLSYIALLGIVASNSTSPQKDERLKDILTMVTNMHALINEYRPHQARETLIGKMEEQVKRKKKEIEGVKSISQRVNSVLDGFDREVPGLHQGVDSKTNIKVVIPSAEESRRGSQRHMWDSIDEILGQ